MVGPHAMKKLKVILICGLLVSACVSMRGMRLKPVRPARGQTPVEYTLQTTGYCSCGACCGWKRDWLGQTVFSHGPLKNKRKRVGYTASGTRALPGTVAADTRIFPMGTIMYIPGYGYGHVEDRGGSIKGHHIDLYFRRHAQAKKWGRQTKRVKVWH